jgi:SAM-dependent methyltransferase
MQLLPTHPPAPADELDLLARWLPLDGARVLELGCGNAEKTRRIAARFAPRELVAAEVDATAHAANLERAARDGDSAGPIRYATFGAEAIDAEDTTFDAVLLFKSLHHVPGAALDRALDEIARVLRPGGRAWVSEPVALGAFDALLRHFHDERAVRTAAFEAVQRSVARGPLTLERELFFTSERHFPDFDAFADAVIHVSHTTHRLDAATLAAVRADFAAHAGPAGARFETPNRVDLLRRAP